MKRFVIGENKFELFLSDNLVCETNFNIELPDEFFTEKYVSLYNLKTYKKFQEKGNAKYLLEQIFYYVKNKLNHNIITLIVHKENYKAVSLYFSRGFKIFIEYDNSYSLIKKL